MTHKMLHVTISDEPAWDLLVAAHNAGWVIKWCDYAASQYHFLLVNEDKHAQ